MDIPVGGSEVSFFGLTSDVAFRSVSFVQVGYGDGFGVDNVLYGGWQAPLGGEGAAVPLPSTLPLMAVVVAGAYVAIRRRSAKRRESA